MWKSLCCIFIAFAFGISLTIINILLTQKGHGEATIQNYDAKVHLSAKFGWDRLHIDVKYPRDYRNKTIDESYSHIHKKFCPVPYTNRNANWCSNLNKLKKTCTVYFYLNNFGLLCMAIAIMLCVSLLVARCTCKYTCKGRCKYTIFSISLLALILYLISFILILKQLNKNWKEMLTSVVQRYYPAVSKITNWKSSKYGISIYFLIGTCAILFISFLFILYVERNYGYEIYHKKSKKFTLPFIHDDELHPNGENNDEDELSTTSVKTFNTFSTRKISNQTINGQPIPIPINRNAGSYSHYTSFASSPQPKVLDKTVITQYTKDDGVTPIHSPHLYTDTDKKSKKRTNTAKSTSDTLDTTYDYITDEDDDEDSIYNHIIMPDEIADVED